MKPLTTKQRHLLKQVVLGNVDKTGARVSNIDYTQVLERLPYKTSRDSLMCSVRILTEQGWLLKGGKELRDGRMKQTLVPSAAAIRVLNPPAPAKVPEYLEISDPDSDVLELILV